MQLLTAADGDLDFHPAAEKVHRQRDQRQPFVAGLLDEFLHLAAVQQQLAPALRLVIEKAGLWINGDVTADQPQFIFANARIGFVK